MDGRATALTKVSPQGAHERRGGQHFGVLIERDEGWVVSALDGATFPVLGTGEIQHQIGGQLGMFPVFGDGGCDAIAWRRVSVRAAIGKALTPTILLMTLSGRASDQA